MNAAYNYKVEQFKARHGIGPRYRMQKRDYSGAVSNRLTADWRPSTSTSDSEIRYDIEGLRARSRDMERNNPLFKRWLGVLCNNILNDDTGFSLQMKAANSDGTLDMGANDKIEMAWREWCKKQFCSETGEYSFFDVCDLVLRSAARDGGFMVQPLLDPNANDFGFTLRLFEIDYLDVNYNTVTPGGNRIVMGVEKNSRRQTVAYHMLKEHPGDMMFGSGGRGYGDRMRVPAEHLIHYFVKHRESQCVGVPWGAPSMLKLRHLDKYQEAEVVAAREAAVKGGYFTSVDGTPYAGEKEETTTSTGTIKTGTLNDFEPGMSDQLPPGMTFTPYDPTHPTQQFGDFVMAMNFEIASGFEVSYATLTGDLRGANYSSMRVGRQEEQQGFKKAQCHLIRHLVMDIFERWLPQALVSGMVQLPFAGLRKFNKPRFTGRRWASVDPQTDVTADLMRINGGLTTRSRICEETGEDYEDVIEELAYEKELAEEAGLEFANPNTGGVVKNPAAKLAPAEQESEK